MHQHHHSDKFTDANAGKLLLVGQANVGKSVIFTELTGRYVDISNYPGTTVEIVAGRFNHYQVIDTPGLSGVIPRSEDERVTFELLSRAGENTVLVHVADAKNLKRSLLLTLTLAEAGIPMVLALNMIDEAEKRGYYIDEKKLSEILGIPVVKSAAAFGVGIGELKHSFKNARVSGVKPVYDPVIENAIESISSLIEPAFKQRSRFVAIMLLSSGLSFVDEFLSKESKELRREIKNIILKTQSRLSEPISLVIIQSKTDIVEKIYREVVSLKGKKISQRLSARIGDPAFHPVIGYFILFSVLYLMYEFVGVFAAGTLVDLLETKVFDEVFLPLLNSFFKFIPSGFIHEIFLGEYGLISMGLKYAVAIVFPIVTAFFLLFSLLEDSGYLPRLGVLLNNAFEKLGLNGKAVVPIVLGLGCGTMATIVTRVLETRRERIIATLLLALGIPCSAQLGVILGFFSQIGFKALLLFFFLIGIQLALVGYLASKIVPGKRSAFLAELPPYRVPRLKNVALKTYHRAKWFVKEAIPLFLIGTLILFVADKVKILPLISHAVSPVVTGWLNLPEKTAESFILGFLRRDYGTAGLFSLFEKGVMDKLQAFVSMIVITLFVPCIANFLVIIKERGLKVALAIVSFVFAYAFLAGGIINYILRVFKVTF